MAMDLEQFAGDFVKFSLSEEKVTIVFKKFGIRFLISLAGNDYHFDYSKPESSQISQYGGTLEIPQGTGVKLVERHGSYHVTSIPGELAKAFKRVPGVESFGGKAWSIEKQINMCSIGGNLETVHCLAFSVAGMDEGRLEAMRQLMREHGLNAAVRSDDDGKWLVVAWRTVDGEPPEQSPGEKKPRRFLTLDFLEDVNNIDTMYINGKGPFDKDYFLAASVMKAVDGMSRRELAAFSRELSAAHPDSRWVKRLSANDRPREIMTLLNDEKPAVRLLGVILAGCLKKDDEMVAALRKIVAEDPFVLLANRNAWSAEPDETAEEANMGFTAPLRIEAIKALEKWKIDAVIDEKSVVEAGMRRFMDIYTSSTDIERKSMIEMLKSHGAGSPVWKAIHDFNVQNLQPKQKKIIELFRKALP
ncbi:MAG: hypothetical protein K5787_21010 [Lentisphaeria bacterium]|nr:hypothetical protein [Victivallales bacterium]MCR4576245.1 hypothetical protein [Lentisphaeria bacterium]